MGSRTTSVGRTSASAVFALAFVGVLALTAAEAAAGGTRGAARDPSEAQIVVTEQGGDQIMVFESEPDGWADAIPLWTWKPTTENGLGDLTDNWGLPDEAKLRHRGGQAYLLTTDSYGLAAVVPYPEGAPVYWAIDAGRDHNPHSIELLPDGNVAVAASHGDHIRVYTASQGANSNDYVEFVLPGGHGVFWDDRRDLLWAIGDDHLVALEVGGTPAAPTLTEVRRAELPTSGGHDLQPVAADPDRLWLTTSEAVYQYSIEEDAFHSDFPGAETINRAAVKSVGDEGGSVTDEAGSVPIRAVPAWC